MNIIGFVASPRTNGSTAWAVNTILEGAREQGAQAQAFYAGALDIKPCKGCLACTKTGKCVIDDDMRQIYSALQWADALVLGSPVYMGQMTAQITQRMFRLLEFDVRAVRVVAGTRGGPAWEQEGLGAALKSIGTGL